MFDLTSRQLTMAIPLPPSKNALRLTTRNGGALSSRYKEWLWVAAPMLRSELGDWEPDTHYTWHLYLRLTIGHLADPLNFIEAVADLLGGTCAATGEEVDADGVRYAKGKAYKQPGLVANDRQLTSLALTTVWWQHPEPIIELKAEPWKPLSSVSWTEAEKSARRAAKEYERDMRAKAKQSKSSTASLLPR